MKPCGNGWPDKGDSRFGPFLSLADGATNNRFLPKAGIARYSSIHKARKADGSTGCNIVIDHANAANGV